MIPEPAKEKKANCGGLGTAQEYWDSVGIRTITRRSQAGHTGLYARAGKPTSVWEEVRVETVSIFGSMAKVVPQWGQRMGIMGFVRARAGQSSRVIEGSAKPYTPALR